MDGKEEKRIIKRKESSIIKDKKQVKVGIPKDFVKYLQIDPEKDIILWSIVSNENEQISLEGHLIKGGKLNNEKTKN